MSTTEQHQEQQQSCNVQNPEIKEISTIGTHSGTFHADEAMALAILKLIPEFSIAKVYRSRDTEFLNTMDMLVDVGSIYDPKTLRFDHHQREFQETFSPKHTIRLSSAGLIYKHYGLTAIKTVLSKDNITKYFPTIPKDMIIDMSKALDNETEEGKKNYELIFKKIYSRLIHAMDGIDNGVQQYPATIKPEYSSTTSLECRIGRLNPSWYNELYQTKEQIDLIKISQNDNIENIEKFQIAIQFCQDEFLFQIQDTVFSWLSGRSIVANAIEQRFNHHTSGRIVLSQQFCPWKGHFFDLLDEEVVKTKAALLQETGDNSIETKIDTTTVPLGKIMFFVYPSGSSWRYLAVPQTPSSFEIKIKFPPTWKGLRDTQLEEATGLQNLAPAFVHHTGFTGGASTKEGLLDMLAKALEYNDQQQQ